MTEESGFLKAILANPADDLVRLVYADWLDERQTDEASRKAEFLREQHFVRTAGDGAKGVKKHHARIRQLAGQLPVGWLAAVSHTGVENCEAGGTAVGPWFFRRRPLDTVEFAYQCPKEWAAMRPTADDAVRHCDACRQDVYFCGTIGEARDHAWQGHCVAVSVGVGRKPGDLEHPRSMMTAGIVSPTFFDLPEGREDDETKHG